MNTQGNAKAKFPISVQHYPLWSFSKASVNVPIRLHNLDAKLFHLSPEQKQEMSNLVTEYPHLFQDVPTKTDAIYHPFRMNPVKAEKMHAEVKYMLENELIECCHSEWSSPCL